MLNADEQIRLEALDRALRIHPPTTMSSSYQSMERVSIPPSAEAILLTARKFYGFIRETTKPETPTPAKRARPTPRKRRR